MRVELSIPLGESLDDNDRFVIDKFWDNVDNFAFAANEEGTHIVLYAVPEEETEENKEN
jgi:hypothetical protein